MQKKFTLATGVCTGANRGQASFVNASVWGMLLTGRVVRLDEDITDDTSSWMRRLVSTLGEPVVRQAVLQAIRIMGRQYVLGRTIEEGLQKGVAGKPGRVRDFLSICRARAHAEVFARRYFESYAATC